MRHLGMRQMEKCNRQRVLSRGAAGCDPCGFGMELSRALGGDVRMVGLSRATAPPAVAPPPGRCT